MSLASAFDQLMRSQREKDERASAGSLIPFLSLPLLAIALVSPIAANLPAQTTSAPPESLRVPRPSGESRAAQRGIQDNSFLLEESYNQVPGVVQHISGLAYDARARSLAYQFVQEWPLGGRTNQVSYNVSVLHEGASGTGVGDSKLNYRYQLVGDEVARIAVASRLSALLPTGEPAKGRGVGSMGLEIWLPASLVLSDRFVAHANAGFTLVPNARGANGVRATTRTWTSAASVVWLATSRFNALVEVVRQSAEEVAGPGSVTRRSNTTVSPGVRWAYNFTSGLQIVPGVGMPVDVASPERRRRVFFYLSFEHRFAPR